MGALLLQWEISSLQLLAAMPGFAPADKSLSLLTKKETQKVRD